MGESAKKQFTKKFIVQESLKENMLAILIASALCYVSNAAGKIEASWSFCTGKDAQECPYGNYANITTEVFKPNPPPVGMNFSIDGMGYSFEDITDPSYELTVQDGAFVNANIKEDGCKPYKYSFTLNDGYLYYNGIDCPIKTGPVTVSLTSFIAKKAPDGTAVATLKLFDQPKQKGNCVLCTVTTLKISG